MIEEGRRYRMRVDRVAGAPDGAEVVAAREFGGGTWEFLRADGPPIRLHETCVEPIPQPRTARRRAPASEAEMATFGAPDAARLKAAHVLAEMANWSWAVDKGVQGIVHRLMSVGTVAGSSSDTAQALAEELDIVVQLLDALRTGVEVARDALQGDGDA
jgi:hypothetical protein